MRRILAGLMAMAVLAGAAACTAGGGSGGKPSVAAGAVREGTVLVRAAGGLAAVTEDGERLAAWVAGAEASPGGEVLYRMDGRHLEMVDPSRGRATRVIEVGDGMAVRTVGPGGRRVIVMPAGLPAGRETTELYVIDTVLRTVKKHYLGNVEPEALSVDGTSAFVVEYSPPLQPDRYRVRRLDLATGELGDVFSPDKHLQEEMQGTARTQVMAPDGKRLYTLYTLADAAGGEPVAFIHVLDLEGQWAHCIDLPAPVGRQAETAVGLALDQEGERVYAIDRAGRAVAEVDTVNLRAVQSVERPELVFDGGTPAAAVTGGRLYVAGGERVHVLDTATLRPAQEAWSAPGPVDALRPAAGGRLLLAAIGRQVAVLDAADGHVVRTFDLRS